jgi:superfamily I DNA/RNA helicase
MDVSKIFESLNEAQRKAVSSESQNLLVLAGAGSGKTRVIAHRVAWLIEILNVNPQSILTVTFTNKAAKEMKERVLHYLYTLSQLEDVDNILSVFENIIFSSFISSCFLHFLQAPPLISQFGPLFGIWGGWVGGRMAPVQWGSVRTW